MLEKKDGSAKAGDGPAEYVWEMVPGIALVASGAQPLAAGDVSDLAGTLADSLAHSGFGACNFSLADDFCHRRRGFGSQGMGTEDGRRDWRCARKIPRSCASENPGIPARFHFLRVSGDPCADDSGGPVSGDGLDDFVYRGSGVSSTQFAGCHVPQLLAGVPSSIRPVSWRTGNQKIVRLNRRARRAGPNRLHRARQARLS